jgi:hypothetical protein
MAIRGTMIQMNCLVYTYHRRRLPSGRMPRSLPNKELTEEVEAVETEVGGDHPKAVEVAISLHVTPYPHSSVFLVV